MSKLPTNKKVLFLTIGGVTTPSTRTRVYQYSEHLKNDGICFKIIPLNKYRIFRYLQLFLLAPLYDVIFLQKVEICSFGLELFNFLLFRYLNHEYLIFFPITNSDNI